MQTEREYRRELVVGEYRVLLRMEGELYLPSAYPKIRDFYKKLLDNTMKWGKEVCGRNLCTAYAALPNAAEKSRFPTTRCMIFTEISYEDEKHAVILASARWSGAEAGIYRYAGVWDLGEERLLPPRQAARFPKIKETLDAYEKN